MKDFFKSKYTISIFLAVSAFLLFWFSRAPRTDKDWDLSVKVLPEISIQDNIVKIHNLRDFGYTEKDKISNTSYYDDAFDLSKMKEMYFLVNPFSKDSVFAHTFFSFNFTDGKSVSVSIEARKQKGEQYSAIKGLFNNYELSILWGSEKDFLSRRSVYYDEDLFRYKLLVSTSTASSLLSNLAHQTIELNNEPKFYNTVFANCTNILADTANAVNPDSIPWNTARVFTGNADKYLYSLSLIDNDIRGFEYVKDKSNISPKIRKLISGNPGITRLGFSKLINLL